MNVVDEIDVSLVVTRDSLSLGTLQLDAPGTYEIMEFGPGGRTWRRNRIEGRYQHGGRSVGEVVASATLTGAVRVYGETWAQVRTRAQAMIDAFSQHAYIVVAEIDGVIDYYACEPADVTIVGGDVWQKHHLMAKMQEYQFTMPYDVLGVPS